MHKFLSTGELSDILRIWWYMQGFYHVICFLMIFSVMGKIHFQVEGLQIYGEEISKENRWL